MTYSISLNSILAIHLLATPVALGAASLALACPHGLYRPQRHVYAWWWLACARRIE